jgi:hypothetical protein
VETSHDNAINCLPLCPARGNKRRIRRGLGMGLPGPSRRATDHLQPLFDFNRFSMIVVDTKVKMGNVRNLRMAEFDLPAEAPPNVKYVPEDVNGGFEKTMICTHKNDPKRKVTLTEKSSRRISHTSKLICGRDEDTDIFRKVYRFERENDPARDIAMQCMEYQLSTLGGRKGCNDD